MRRENQNGTRVFVCLCADSCILFFYFCPEWFIAGRKRGVAQPVSHRKRLGGGEKERGATTALADLEEAVSGVSLSQPEGGALGDVHVRCLHHALIDPGGRKQLIRCF